MTLRPPHHRGRGARLAVRADGPDRAAIGRALSWLVDRMDHGRHGVLVVPTLRQLDDGCVLAVAIGAEAVEVARDERRFTIELDDQVHRGDVRTEQTFDPARYLLVSLALAALWPSDAVLRRIERETPGSDVLAVSWVGEQAERWARTMWYRAVVVPAPTVASGTLVGGGAR